MGSILHYSIGRCIPFYSVGTVCGFWSTLFYSILWACVSESDVGKKCCLLFPVILMLFSFNIGGDFFLSFMVCHFVKSAFNCALCLDPDFFIAPLFVDHKWFLMGHQPLLYCSVNDISYFPDNMKTPLIVTVGYHGKCMLF